MFSRKSIYFPSKIYELKLYISGFTDFNKQCIKLLHRVDYALASSGMEDKDQISVKNTLFYLSKIMSFPFKLR